VRNGEEESLVIFQSHNSLPAEKFGKHCFQAYLLLDALSDLKFNKSGNVGTT